MAVLHDQANENSEIVLPENPDELDLGTIKNFRNLVTKSQFF